MGKRSNFDRVPRDFYPTPADAVAPLLPHLPTEAWYVEPCAGDGTLIAHLNGAGHRCVYGADIEPRSPLLRVADATSFQYDFRSEYAQMFITNPPWDRKVLHPIIANLCEQAPTWLLFDADWMHTRQSASFLPMLRKVVSVGRVKWIPDSPFTSKDNCCWYLFDAHSEAPAEFVGRRAA
jgi:hypothetical protein